LGGGGAFPEAARIVTGAAGGVKTRTFRRRRGWGRRCRGGR
jgi:hypothetical protein